MSSGIVHVQSFPLQEIPKTNTRSQRASQFDRDDETKPENAHRAKFRQLAVLDRVRDASTVATIRNRAPFRARTEGKRLKG